LYGALAKTDPKAMEIMKKEVIRIRNGVELIPSENFVSKAVLQAMATVFTNKYSEGYPGKRYYGGNEFIDMVENLAIERAKKLFGAEHVNVQPYSGSPANMAVYLALLDFEDKFLGFDLCCGGHLTHGSPVNFSGRWYRVVAYAVDKETELIDMDEVRKIALREKPKLIQSGFTAYPRTLNFKAFQEIADEVGAYHFSDISHIAGLCASGVHPNPVPFADVVTTTTHKTLRGPRGAMIMCRREDKYKEKYHPKWKKNLAGMIDFNVFPGIQGGPHDHITLAKAVAFHEDLQPEFKDYSRQIVKNARAMAEGLMSHDIKLFTNGTDNHLMLIDLTKKNLTGKGKEVQNALEEAGIFVNKNTIPFEPSSPFYPSGIRLGTPAITSRGMKESDMEVIAKGIATVIDDYKNKTTLEKVRLDILELCKQFPLYPDF
jgi:glycine hydroxymethyltransferase